MRYHLCSGCRKTEPVNGGGYCRECHNAYMRKARALGKWKHTSLEYKSIRLGKIITREHRLILGIFDPKVYVHHKDNNPRNNIPDNLEAMTPKEHYAIHHQNQPI